MTLVIVIQLLVIKIVIVLLECRNRPNHSRASSQRHVLFPSCGFSPQVLAFYPNTDEKHFEAGNLSALVMLNDSVHAFDRVKAYKSVAGVDKWLLSFDLKLVFILFHGTLKLVLVSILPRENAAAHRCLNTKKHLKVFEILNV